MARTPVGTDQLASERFEVACYTALVSAATELGYPEVAQLCRENLNEDQARATCLLQKAPSVVSCDALQTAPRRAAG